MTKIIFFMYMQHNSWNKTLNQIFYSKTKVSKIQQQKLPKQNKTKMYQKYIFIIKTIIEGNAFHPQNSKNDYFSLLFSSDNGM